MTDNAKSVGEQNYEQFADRYAAIVETKPHNAYYERPATLALLPDVNRLRVLDAGCGPGFYAEWLDKHGAEVVSFDVTPRFVEITKQRVSAHAQVLLADLTQPLTFAADSSFDVVLCPLVLDNIEDWHAVFAEFFRVLKSGGVFLFSCGHPLGDYLFLTRRGVEVKNYYDVEPFTVEWYGFGDPKPTMTGFRRSFSAVIEPLLSAGFVIDTIAEPLPTLDFKAADPEGYERLMKQPGFLFVRAKKS